MYAISILCLAGIEVGFGQSVYQFDESIAQSTPVSLCVELVDGVLERSASVVFSAVEIPGQGSQALLMGLNYSPSISQSRFHDGFYGA